jgi:hypothetical protein
MTNEQRDKLLRMMARHQLAIGYVLTADTFNPDLARSLPFCKGALDELNSQLEEAIEHAEETVRK